MDDNNEGLKLPPRTRALLTASNVRTGRRMIQPIEGKDLGDGDRRVGGIPVAVLLTLAEFDDLAQKGNRLAARVAVKIRRDWGIVGPTISAPGMKIHPGEDAQKPPIFTVHGVHD